MKLKVVLYNILNGFCNDNPPFKIDSKRVKSALEIIAEQNPDILILTEAYFWPFAKKVDLENLREVFSELYNEYTSLANGYFRWAPIILSKYPINNFDTSMSKYQLNFMRANLQVGKNQLVLDVFHPHPDTTEEQKAEFLKPLLENCGENHLLVGDFNALSPQDDYDVPKLVKGYESFMKGKGKLKVGDMLEYQTIKTILERGFIDIYKKTNPDKKEFTMPTDLRSKNKDSAIRIDYMFCSDNFEVVESGVVKNKLTERASDHYPVYATIKV
jgi:exonuclease III